MNPNSDIIVVFEDAAHVQFNPLALSRPVCELLTGARTGLQRIKHFFDPCRVTALCRPCLTPLFDAVTAEALIELAGVTDGRVLFINGRTILRQDDRAWIESLKTTPTATAYLQDNTLIAAVLPSRQVAAMRPESLKLHEPDATGALQAAADKTETVTALTFDFIWDPMRLNPELLTADFELFYRDRVTSAPIGDAVVYGRDAVFAAPDVSAAATVVIDARPGPVILEAGVKIQPFTYIEGPAYIGPNTWLVGGKLTDGCSLGSGCRVGGEVENTIIVANTNKYHDGFLGHAYVGEWVNFGALTTNSDLRNDYGEISVKQNRQTIKTGHIKIGSFIGDHAKTGIGMTLNTGAMIGFGANLFGGCLIIEKAIPGFAWGNDAIRLPGRLPDVIQTARTAMGRRGAEFTEHHKHLFQTIFENTQTERKQWMRRAKKGV